MLSQTLFALLAVLAVNAQTITSPAAVIQCQPARFDLSGGEAPYIVDVIPAGEVTAAAIAFIGSDLPAGGLTWTPDLPAGSNVTFRITDASGSPQYSSPTVIQAGNSDSCLNSSATSGIPTAPITTTNTASVSSGSASASSVSGSSAAGTTSSAASSSSMSASSSGGAASGASNSLSSATNAASSAASSAAATSTPNGASPTGIAGAGALAAGIIGGVAMLF